MYAIKEIYYTLQGEGFHSGRAAIFCRFSGCNLWSGREEDRHKAICQFCDTDFWGTDGLHGGKYNKEDLVKTCINLWGNQNDCHPFIVFTGGEPALQLDQELVDIFHEHQFEIAIETNGTIELANHIDWVCVSPKANTEILVQNGDELKLVFPQSGIDPVTFESLAFTHLYLQPMDGPDIEENRWKTVTYCREHPKWKLSLQMHKVLDIP